VLVAERVALEGGLVRVPPRRLVFSAVVVVVDEDEEETVALEELVGWEEVMPEADGLLLVKVALPVAMVLPSKSEGTLGPMSELVSRRAEPLRVSNDCE
jgi:hypothetical protein